ncbi:MAG: HupE/UreJ family protein [Chakrabartia sp.]
MRHFLALLLFLFAAAPACADELRPGYLDLTEIRPLHWRMTWKGPLKSGLASRATPVLPEGCTASPPSRELDEVALRVVWTLSCRAPLAGKEIRLQGLDRTVADALLRIAPLGEPVQTARLTPDRPGFVVAAKASRWDVAKTYLIIGVEHILFGFDHLFFVVALVLLLRRGGTILKAVTAFTLAHSLTLIGTTLGFLGLPQRPVESVIALSIMFLAVEIVKARPEAPRLSQRIPWVVAFLFGLLHGFGFAGALKEIGLPQGEVPMALLTFNLGVEAGQVVIVLATMAALALIERLSSRALRPAIMVATYAIGIIASYWFIERTLV